MDRGYRILPRLARRRRWGRVGQAEPTNEQATGFFISGCVYRADYGVPRIHPFHETRRKRFQREFHATRALLSRRSVWPSAVTIKKTAFFAVGKLGISDANILSNVVLWVATTLFGETAGSEALIPVARHNLLRLAD